MRIDLQRLFVSTLAVGLSVFVPAKVLAAPQCNSTRLLIEVSATSLAFGNYSPASALPTDSNSTVTVFCANNTNILPSFTVSLSAGGAGSFNPRKMSNGGSRLSYNMYTNSAHTIIWGDGTSGTSMQSYDSSLKLSQVSFTDFGRVPPAQVVSSGVYSDLITVTVTY
jgi:spore coat protein U-like protein